MMLENLFKQFEVPLWGIGSLGKALQRAHEYRCIAFTLPYDNAAIEALPDGGLIDRCKRDLGEKTKEIYEAITEELGHCGFVSYDDADREFGLREKGISQKVLGYLAGLGWIGRSSLLVTPVFGPRVRLGTIITRDDIGLTGHAFFKSCGECKVCSEACPAGAISKNGYNVGKCKEIVTDAQGKYKTFCGLCMKVCPIGNDKQLHAADTDFSTG
jgi:epoxyqueuosine reductase QueG